MDQIQTIPVTLTNGSKLNIEFTKIEASSDTRDKEQVVSGFRETAFKDVMAPIEGLSGELLGVLKRVGPNKASVEFGIEIGVESGKLTALLVKGSGKANLKVTLSWEQSQEQQQYQDQMAKS